MRRNYYLILFFLILVSCNTESVYDVDCISLADTKQTVLQGIRFGDPLNSVINKELIDTTFLYVDYQNQDTCLSFVSFFGGSPARFYLSFRKEGLCDVQIRTPNPGYLSSIPHDTLRKYEDEWFDAVVAIYGLPAKILFKRNDYCWSWHICNGPVAAMRSLNIMNSAGE